MGEKVVIAELVIDESGAIKSINATSGAEKNLERQTESTGNAVTKHFFNMRRTVTAFLGAFTIAGAVMGLKNMVSEALRMDQAWTSIKNTARAALEVLSEGASGTEWIRNILDSIPKLIASFAGLIKTVGQPGMLWEMLFGDWDKFMAKYKANIAEIQARSRAITVRDFLGLPSPSETREILSLSGNIFESYSRALLSGKMDLNEYFQALDKVVGSLSKLRMGYVEVANAASIVNVLYREGKISLGDAAVAVEHLRALLARLNPTEEQKKAFEGFVNSITLSVSKAKAELELLNEAAQAAGQALSSALFESGMSAKEAVALLMKQIAIIAITQALMHLAAAYAATTLIGAAATGGTTQQHLAIAAFWGKVAAGAAAAALALGARSSGAGGFGRSGPGGSFGAANEVGGGGGPVYNISFNINGNVLGTEDWARQQVIWIKRALADGSGGGTF